jgi:hypothetical protein
MLQTHTHKEITQECELQHDMSLLLGINFQEEKKHVKFVDIVIGIILFL